MYILYIIQDMTIYEWNILKIMNEQKSFVNTTR